MQTRQSLEERIDDWRQQLERHATLHPTDTDELEDHLRSQIDALREVGLREEEAFLVAVKRMGDSHELAHEFSVEYSERLWKQLMLPNTDASSPTRGYRDSLIVLSLAVGAAIAVKLPQLFGVRIGGSPETNLFYARNFSLLVLPFLALLFIWRRRLSGNDIARVVAPFLAAALVVNLMPFVHQGSTEMLAIIHLPIALWFAAGVAYMGGRWTHPIQRMNFVRFSGEWFIYTTLIAFGGGVLMIFTLFIFESIGLNAESFVTTWLLPCGVAGAVVISGWLVEAKQSIIENMAPVLTRLFTPLFTLLLLSYIVAMLISGKGILVERDMLIGFDLLLVLILGLLLYAISARDPEAPPDLFDHLQFLLVVSALLVDLLALWAIAVRISDFGFSPNKVAALGENLILLVNLAGAAFLSGRFLLGKGRFAALERWQTAYFPVYPIWAGIVVAVFPLLFRFA